MNISGPIIISKLKKDLTDEEYKVESVLLDLQDIHHNRNVGIMKEYYDGKIKVFGEYYKKIPFDKKSNILDRFTPPKVPKFQPS